MNKDEKRKKWYIRFWQWIKESFSNILSKLGIKRKNKNKEKLQERQKKVVKELQKRQKEVVKLLNYMREGYVSLDEISYYKRLCNAIDKASECINENIEIQKKNKRI